MIPASSRARRARGGENRHYIVIAALKALADDGVVHVSKVAEAIAKYGINADKINPLYA